MWTYRCRVRKVVDGDTLDLVVDLGFQVELEVRVRLLGVNAPEVRGPEREAGLEVEDRVMGWLLEHEGFGRAGLIEWPLVVVTSKEGDKYGRWLGHVMREFETDGWRDAESLNGLVKEWTREAMERHGLEELRYG